MSSSYRTVPMSSSYRRGMLSMNERGEFVSDDGDEDGETCLQPNKGGVKFFSDTEGLIQKMFYRRDVSDLNLGGSYKKSTLESIRNWETTKGKRALLCGVTYNKQKYKLKGANKDVINMRELLISRFQFPSNSIRILAEMEMYPHPTKRNIREALRWLVKDNQPGDSLVFYFSGHGSPMPIPDFFDDELDGFDETICPVDFKTEGTITDCEINDTIVRPLKSGVKLHAIVDASHSGTILDLSNVYCTKEHVWLDNHPPSGYNYKGTSGGHAISIGAYEDNKLAIYTSASESGKQMQGAMTYAFRKAVVEKPSVSYVGLLVSMNKDISVAEGKKCSLPGLFYRVRIQEPLLSSSKEFDLNEPFVL